MKTVTFYQPKRLSFGAGCLAECVTYVAGLGSARVHIVAPPYLAATVGTMAAELRQAGCSVSADASVAAEPTIAAFTQATAKARAAGANCVIGLGGGSALDLAKLVAAFVDSEQRVEDCFGIGLLRGRSCHLVCAPTTSGTGSEVSPNAILLDEEAKLKKGVVSPFLVPDAAFIDPVLTVSVPPSITAFTGLDALTHCVEAYTNLFAHPMVDVYAIEGIRLANRFLARAVREPRDREAREGMALASMYGGLCLGPVNTAAVHALAYPLGGEFHMAHGLSIAVLLPHLFRFNAEASPRRHADVAMALGIAPRTSDLETALAGADRLDALVRECGIEMKLGAHGVGPDAIPAMAAAAMSVQRLLKNNPRPVTEADCVAIYQRCFE